MKKILILSIYYYEPEWIKTNQCIVNAAMLAQSVPHSCFVSVHYVDRKGYGSLSEAINRGFKEANGDVYNYVWIVTNPTFNAWALPKLIDAMVEGYAAIHPAFNSDHKHLQPDGSNEVKEVPYIEFTAPIIRCDVFNKFPLDDLMPFWGQDLDWSYRVQQAGYKVAVHHGVQLQHEYIRNNKKQHPVTLKRQRQRNLTNASTKARLIEKYGNNWRETLKYFG